MSLRARMVLVAAAAVAFTVAGAAAIVFFLVRNELRGQVNGNLRAQAERISHSPGLAFATPLGKNRFLLRMHQDPFGNPFQLVDYKGGIYLPEVGFDQIPKTMEGTLDARLVAKGTKGAFFSDGHYNDQHVRIFTSPIVNGKIAIQVAAPLTSVDNELAQIKLWLILVALGGVGIAAIAGFLVARAALAPVRDLSDTAERVRSTRDLTQRIRVKGRDELSRLAETFNGMLASLDEAAVQQRRLVQDASHELRTPLTSLRTNIELLATRGDDLRPDDRTQLLEDVVEQIGEMTLLIGELTELARGEQHAPAAEEVRLDLVTQDAIRRTTRNHPTIPIVAKLDETTVVGVPANLERAIGNLLDNAAKWSPVGAEVDVTLHDGELVVRDHGPGIAESDLPHVFERFYRATSARGMPGSGLGLAIVRQVAEAHGGSVSAEAPAGGGTVMRLRLNGSVQS